MNKSNVRLVVSRAIFSCTLATKNSTRYTDSSETMTLQFSRKEHCKFLTDQNIFTFRSIEERNKLPYHSNSVVDHHWPLCRGLGAPWKMLAPATPSWRSPLYQQESKMADSRAIAQYSWQPHPQGLLFGVVTDALSKCIRRWFSSKDK